MRKNKRSNNRFHGRVQHDDRRQCDHANCEQAGEFRAPKSTQVEEDGYYWFCLDHVRAYNEGWNFFENATPAQNETLTNGLGGWERPTWPFGLNGATGADATLKDPLNIFKDLRGFERFRDEKHPVHGKAMNQADKMALDVLGLDADATQADIRKRYRSLLKRYHPDVNGGTRAQETQLRRIIEAYKHLMNDDPRAT